MSGVLEWMKHTAWDSIGLNAVLNGLVTFGGSVMGQEKTVRAVEAVALGLNDFIRGEITEEQARSLVASGVVDLVPWDYLATFADSEMGKKPAVQGTMSVISGMLGLMRGTDDRDEARRQIGSGVDLMFFTEPPADLPAQ